MELHSWISENITWINIIKDLGIFSIAAFFIQRILDNSANRKLEKYKHELDVAIRQYQSSLDNDLEKFKGDLALQLNVQNSLHEKHVNIIDQMYKYLVELDSAMREMTAAMKPVYEDAEKEDQERVERAQKAFKEYSNYYLFHKLYFKEDVCNLLEIIQKDYWSANYDYFEPKRLSSFTNGRPTPAGYREAIGIANAATEKIKVEIPKTLRLLEIEFKRLMGVIR
jgi:hypothetical protein